MGIMTSQKLRQDHAKVAARTRWGRPEEEIIEAKRDLKAHTAAQYIQALVDEAPELSPDQLARLRSILTPPENAL